MQTIPESQCGKCLVEPLLGKSLRTPLGKNSWILSWEKVLEPTWEKILEPLLGKVLETLLGKILGSYLILLFTACQWHYCNIDRGFCPSHCWLLYLNAKLLKCYFSSLNAQSLPRDVDVLYIHTTGVRRPGCKAGWVGICCGTPAVGWWGAVCCVMG